MRYTFSIHGVPYGNQAWGNIRDKEYLKSFYNSVSAYNVPSQMIVDIRLSGSAICSYYHYLILSNVYDFESRPDSYFGMTICFEGVYCSDFVELYKLFDTCFQSEALNTVLIKSGERYKYVLSDFASPNNITALKRVDAGIRENIHLFERDLIAFPKNFMPKHRDDGGIEKWSIDDVGNNTFVNTLLKDSMASISPFYPVLHNEVKILQGDNRTKDNKIKALESDNGNLQSENEGLRTRISDQEKDIETQRATIRRQDVVITERKETIETLESERIKLRNALKETKHQIEVLKEELKQAQNNRDDETLLKCLSALETIAHKRTQADQLIYSISPRLKKAEESIEHIDNQLNKKRAFRLTSHHLLLGGLVVVAMTAVAGVFLPSQTSWKGDFATKDNVRTMIEGALSKGGSLSTYANTADGNEVSFIDVQEISKDEYRLTAKKGLKGGYQSLETGGGEFFIQSKDGTKTPIPSADNGKTAILHATPHMTRVDIIYCVRDEVIQSRTIKVSKKHK